MKEREKKTTLISAMSRDFKDKLASDNVVFKIHSVYNQVLNLIDQKNKIYSIIIRNFDNLPAALKVDSLLSFKSLGITLDDKIIVDSETIKIADKLIIYLENKEFRVWDTKLNSLSKINGNNIKNNLIKSTKKLSEESNFRGASYFYLSFYYNLKNNRKIGLVEKYLSGEIKKNIIEMEIDKKNPLSIIGLGLGLTPSGDDFLTGYLGVMGIMNLEYSKKIFNNFKNKILESDFSTTDISRAMLLNILNLKARGKISDFIYSINQDFKTFDKALDNVLTIGSTSGCDIAVGVLTAYHEILKNKNCLINNKT